MSTLPENELNLEKLFLPAWAQEDPSAAKYAKYEVSDDRPDRRGDRRGPRPPRRDGPGGPRRDENRQGGDRRGPRREGGGWEAGREAGRGFGRPQGGRREDRPERREPPAPLPEVNLSLVPEDKGVESLARQIRVTGRAYPLFDIAQMILQKPDRVKAVFSVKKNPEGQPVQLLFVCALDDTLWLSEDEAVGHVLKKHFATFYQVEKTAAEPPKGKYTFVAQCGMSGQILGPPNHHDYQNQLRKLHTERFSRMPFEAYKSRVRIVRDEEVVKKWVEDQSWKTEYTCLNMPEPLRLGSMEAVERHFRETHKEAIIKSVETHTVIGTDARSLRSQELARLVRNVWDDQRRFPLQIATVLSQQFASHGLQFFKVNKTVTHVSVARPHYLDLDAAPVSDGIKRIVEFINTHPKCTRRKLVEALAPTPPPAPIPVAPAVETTPAVEAAPAPEATTAPAAPAADPNQPTPEQTAVIADLHWLIHQGHVIEFANGVMETAKKPAPKPPKPEPKPKATETPGAAGETPAAPVGAPAESASAAPAPDQVEPAAPESSVAPVAEVPTPAEAPSASPVTEAEAAPVGEPPAAPPVSADAPAPADEPESPRPQANPL